MMIDLGDRKGIPPLPDGERVAATRPGEGALLHVSKREAGVTKRARELRVNDTEPEYRLWGELRGRRLNGYKFVRQIPLGPYVVDFLCRERCLVVELDGTQHADSQADHRRDKWLNEHGYAVLRFWNHEVLRERRAVLDTLLAVLDGRINSPSPGLRFAPATLSPVGRGGRGAGGHIKSRRDQDTPTPHPSPQGGGGSETQSATVIRPAEVGDLPACADIINDYIDATDWLPRVKSREEIAGFFTPELIEKRTVLVAETGGRIVAYVSVADGFLFAIYLAPAARGGGIGKMLLDDLKARYPEQIELTVYELNVAAQRFYEREGFAEVAGEREDTEEGIPVMRMRWRGAA